MDKLFLKRPPEKPDFELIFPAQLTKRTYVLVVKKIFAVMRHLLYCEIRKIQRARGSKTALSSSAVSGTSNHYLTKNELRKILEELDIATIRRQVFSLYGVQLDDNLGEEQRTLLKAYYTYMSDRHFQE